MLSAIVVDDVAAILRVLTEVLECSGVRVLGRGFNGKDAVELYKKHKPDLVFIYMMMPKYDGLYGFEEIKKINSDAKIVFVTAAETSLDKIAKVKPYAIINKPFGLEDIEKIIKDLSSNPSWVSIAIEQTLLEIGFNALDAVRNRLSDDYNRNFSDCYANPEFLNRILKDLYGTSYKVVVESIVKNLKECAREEAIIKFEKEISI